MTKTARAAVTLFCFFLAGSLLPAQSDTEIRGGIFAGALGLFNFDADASDAALHMGGTLEIGVAADLSGTADLGFLANVSDNDAYDDRSLVFSPGLRYRISDDRNRFFFAGGGYTLTSGERDTRHLAFGGAGYRNWYGDVIGWQLEVRDHFNADVNLLEVRLSVLLR